MMIVESEILVTEGIVNYKVVLTDNDAVEMIKLINQGKKKIKKLNKELKKKFMEQFFETYSGR